MLTVTHVDLRFLPPATPRLALAPDGLGTVRGGGRASSCRHQISLMWDPKSRALFPRTPTKRTPNLWRRTSLFCGLLLKEGPLAMGMLELVPVALRVRSVPIQALPGEYGLCLRNGSFANGAGRHELLAKRDSLSCSGTPFFEIPLLTPSG